MNTFEDMIFDAIKNGKSVDDIAREFTTTLNKINSKEVKRNEILEDFREVLNDHIEKRSLSIGDAVAIATLCTAEDTKEGKEWDATQITDFYDYVDSILTEVPAIFNMFYSLLRDTGSETKFNEIFDKAFSKLFETGNKSKDNCKHDENCGNCHSCDSNKVPKNDRDIVDEFMREFGLK